MVRGLVAGATVKIVQVEWFGEQAVKVTFEEPGGAVRNRLVYRSDEAALELVGAGRAWSFGQQEAQRLARRRQMGGADGSLAGSEQRRRRGLGWVARPVSQHKSRVQFTVEFGMVRLWRCRREGKADAIDGSGEGAAQGDDRRGAPPRYRAVLFADPPEAELNWPGKTSEVTNVVLPFQTIEQIDEPRAEAGAHHVADLFDFDARTGRQSGGWTNKLIWGDHKLVLAALKNGPLRRQIEQAGGLKLVYIDPPFDVGADFSFELEIGDETFTKEPRIIEEIAYRDTWGLGTQSYIHILYERLSLIHDNLKVHHAKVVKGWVARHHERIALVDLPPYAPEHNPDEYLNNDLKQTLRQQPQPGSKAELLKSTRGARRRLQRRPARIRAYFTPAPVRYAA